MPDKNEMRCPICGGTEFTESTYDSYLLCVCGWLQDPWQEENPDDESGANYLTLNDAKKYFRQGKDLRVLNYPKEVDHRYDGFAERMRKRMEASENK